MNNHYYVGSYKEDGLNGPNRGWIVGNANFDLSRTTEAVGIKYWQFQVGPTDHPTKVSSVVECTFILKGKVRGIIDEQEVILSAGDYIVIQPGVKNNTVIEILEAAEGLTIKAPSGLNTKTIVK